MAPPAEIKALVDKFSASVTRFRDPNYNETQVRIEFIDPFFKALGWDVANSLQVVHEDRVLVDDGSRLRVKHPDYGFKIGRDIRFYVEAKKPAVNLKDDPDPAYQVRRYGWSSKLPISILTDFEEFIIYNCVEKPDRNDGAQVARLMYVRYDEYESKWDDLYALFSVDAVKDGALERYIEEAKPKGMITVDEAFLRDMEGWRETLAKDIALHNPDLTRRQLNMAVQRTIDRIVFLRIAEDRNIEPYGRLKRAAENRANVYEELKRQFNEANDKYNSGLFHFTDDMHHETGDPVSMKMTVSDEPLQTIINRLYYPTSPYEFSVLPADILGQVYERFLGKVIELESGGQASVVEKPEVRKAGGVYYTPTYIVDYIVENTVGKLVEGKTPNQAEKLRVLDPACGSGSFLIGAYQYLMDWHLAYYVGNAQKTALTTKKIRETGDPSAPFALTNDEKKRILLNNIYGVDLDQQAVEVTKLSLLLKMLENETASSTATQYAMFGTDERILPDLSENIKWGNSLISSDFYAGKQLSFLDDEEVYRVKAFDWDVEFAEIMSAGGFDAVIGNPPYIRIQTMKETAPETVPYYGKTYVSASKGNYDIYVVFVERGLSFLNPNGRLGYILPHKFFNAKYGEPLRGLIAKGQHLSEVVHFGDQQVFDGATTYTCLLFLTVSSNTNFEYIEIDDLNRWSRFYHLNSDKVPTGSLKISGWNIMTRDELHVYAKLNKVSEPLSVVTERIFQGLKTSADKIYIVNQLERTGEKVKIYSPQNNSDFWMESDLLHPLIKGGDSNRYRMKITDRLILFPYADWQNNGKVELIPSEVLEVSYPLIWQYLMQNKEYLENRERGKMIGEKWYGYVYPKALDVISTPKIFTPDIAPNARYSLDVQGEIFFTGGTSGGYGIIPKKGLNTFYLLALLNSKLLDWCLQKISTAMRGGWYSYESKYINEHKTFFANRVK